MLLLLSVIIVTNTFFLFFMYVNFFVAKLEFVKDQIKYIINGTWTAKQVFCEMKTVKGSNQCNEYIKVKFAMQPQYLNALWKRGRTIILQLLCWIVIQFGVRSMAETLLDEWVFSQLEFLLDFEPHSHSACLFFSWSSLWFIPLILCSACFHSLSSCFWWSPHCLSLWYWLTSFRII